MKPDLVYSFRIFGYILLFKILFVISLPFLSLVGIDSVFEIYKSQSLGMEGIAFLPKLFLIIIFFPILEEIVF